MEPVNVSLKKIILSITKDQLDDIEKNIYEAKLHEDWDRVGEQLKRLDVVEEALDQVDSYNTIYGNADPVTIKEDE